VQKAGITLEPLIMGGGQERDRRSGTTNVAGIVATAAALRATVIHRTTEAMRVASLKKSLVDGITAQLTDVIETVPSSFAVVPGIAHLCIAGVESEALLFLLDEANVCASAASACASGAMEPSHVLRAMGVELRFAKGALRLSLGHTTTQEDVDRAIEVVVASVQRLRAHRPQ
ncbi:MAG: aminotransferase class V-fold PLP-dependent enzyme, partial [Actinomycetota bacterium]